MLRAVVLLAVLAPLPVLAQSADSGGGSRLAFTFGAGIEAVPGYFGSDELAPGFDLSLRAPFLSFGGVRLGRDDAAARSQGLGFRGSFRYVPERNGEEYEELAGLPEIDTSFELGGGLSYAQPGWEAFAVARYGLGGHESWVGELGLNLVAQPTERLGFRAGPRVLFGSEDYADTYFSVPDGTPGFEGFDAEGGLLSAGIEAVSTYALTESWGLRGRIRYERLLNDAADSPITQEDDQFTASLLVTRRFVFEF
ncbi:MipA/OmpV family protein [Rubellimicrobium roseum]|uniref:MipA/OmpV family protein n=1 Tax=Rubellimicrobium roseum TaxID=687525 RepID=A0A5C4N779_9RHOB|nr:MipA/OmpV family protein [Rubellimicrobium roseum]TNC63546.1 MipA/OmpV family protein [Rubellimicrobium roseum]